MTRCQYERYIDLQSRHVDKFVVKCESNGDYKALQCWNSVGLCWCVRKEDGTEIFGSRTYFPNKPRCKALGELLYRLFSISIFNFITLCRADTRVGYKVRPAR